MIQVEIEQMAGSPRMGTAEWVPVTDQGQAQRIISRLFPHCWGLVVRPNGGFGWLFDQHDGNNSQLDYFLLDVIQVNGEFVVGGEEQGYRIRIDAP